MTIRPWPVSALTHASYTSSGVNPCRSGLAARYFCGTGAVWPIIHRLNGNRTQLNPCAAMSSASAFRFLRSRPAGTPRSSLAPYQFTPARRTRLP